MKAAIFIEAAGVPLALAATNFVSTLAHGLCEAGVGVRIVGLGRSAERWRPEALDFPGVSAPWIGLDRPCGMDVLRAAKAGLLTERVDPGVLETEWHRALLLERELREFAAGDTECVAMVYPRDYHMLRSVIAACDRLGWRLFVFATEALNDVQIDSSTRSEYIRCVVERADALWAVSEHLADFWVGQGLSAERILVNPPIVPEAFFEASATPSRSSAAIYMGNLAHREIDYLLEIALQVRRRLPGFTLTIYADATEQQRAEVSGAVADASLEDVVSLRPPVAHRELPALLGSADVLLLPRASGEFSSAGFPNKLGEYLSSGRPVVVTAVGDIPRHLSDRRHAYLVPPDDTERFAEAVVEVLGDQKVADEIGRAGREVARRLAGSDNVAQRVLGLLHSSSPVPAPRRISQGSWRYAVLYASEVATPALKRFIVRVLRALRLKPPAPESEAKR